MNITINELINAGCLEKFCNTYGYNIWAVNEGQLDINETLLISIKNAKKWGLI